VKLLRAGLAFVVVATVLAAAAAASGRVASPSACSLVRVAQSRSILGYPVRIQRGETEEYCVMVSVPIKLDENLHPIHPSVSFGIYADGSHATHFVDQIKQARKSPLFVPLSGLGPLATLSPASDAGHFVIFAKVGANVISLDVGPAQKPISQAQGIRLARAIAARL
jgi:hypothetical protein